MLASSLVIKPRPHHPFRFVAALGLLLVPAQAYETAGADWWTPAANFAEVYDLGGEDSSVSPSGAAQVITGRVSEAISWQAHPLLESFPLSLLGLGAERARENGTKSQAAVKAHQATAAKATATATAQATATPAKVAASAASATSAKVQATSAVKVQAVSAVQVQATSAVKVPAVSAAQVQAASAVQAKVQATSAIQVNIKSSVAAKVKAASAVVANVSAAVVKANSTSVNIVAHNVNIVANNTQATATAAKVETKVEAKAVAAKVEAKVETKVVEATKQIPAVVRKTWYEWLRMSMSFAFVVKALCMASNLLFQASPWPVIKEFSVKGNTGEADSAPFISIAYGSCQWCFYGLFAYIVTSKTGFLVLVYSNVCGTFLGVYYVYAFTIHCANSEVWLRAKVYCQVLAVVAVVQIIAMFAMPPVRALFFSGLISSAWSVVGAMSMLTTVPMVLKTKSCKSLPFPLLLAAEISSILWIGCGIMLRDPWITVPNVCSMTTTSFALSLCWIYPDEPCNEDEEDSEEVAPLLHEGQDETGDRDELVADRPSPLMNLIRTFRGNESDGAPSATAYGRTASMKSGGSKQGITAGTGETWD